MRQRHSYYEYEVIPHGNVLIYAIYDPDYKNRICRESQEWYETEDEAKFAAIEHIDNLENGEG